MSFIYETNPCPNYEEDSWFSDCPYEFTNKPAPSFSPDMNDEDFYDQF